MPACYSTNHSTNRSTITKSLKIVENMPSTIPELLNTFVERKSGGFCTAALLICKFPRIS